MANGAFIALILEIWQDQRVIGVTRGHFHTAYVIPVTFTRPNAKLRVVGER